MQKQDNHTIKLKDPEVSYHLSKHSEEERLRKDVFRSDIEKFRLFTRMLRNNAVLKRAKITHK